MANVERSDNAVWRGVEAAAVLLVLGFLLFTLRGILNPLVLFLLLWAVLTPFRGRPGHTPLLVTTGALTMVWLLATTGSLLAPFVLAVVLAYLLDPVVDRMERLRVPRALAIVLLTLPALALLAVLIFLGIPAAVHQLADVAEEAPVFFQRVAGWLDGLQARLRREALAPWVRQSVLGGGRGTGVVLGVGSYVVLTPVLTFYLLRDWDRLRLAAADLLPAGRKEGILSFAAQYDHLLGRYLRGQIIVAACVGGITGLGLAVVGFPYAAMLGLMVGVFSVVPYLGLILSLAPALFIALVSGSVGISLLKVAVVYTLAQVLEGTVISPRIVGDSVGLHPVWVVLALAVGGFFFGFVGLLIGVPGAVGVKLLVERGLARYRASDLYKGKAAGA